MRELHRFTPQELAGIRRREDEVVRFLAAIAEIHGLPDGLTVTRDETGRAIGLAVDDPGATEAALKLVRTAAN